MNFFWIFITTIHIISLTLLIICLFRLFWHMSESMHMEENKYTRLFGFIRLRHVVVAYILVVAVFTVGTTFLTHLLSNI